MPLAKLQTAFTAGELSPGLYARLDIDKFNFGLKTCRNALVHPHGGVSNRPGSKFVAYCASDSQQSRLIPFEFNTDQTYILEFGHYVMRVFMDGGQVLNGATGITGATQANPVVVTSAAHGASNGEEVYIYGVVGMTELNGKKFIVAGTTANTFELKTRDGANVDGTGYGAYAGAGAVQRVYAIATPYPASDLPQLKFAQSADTMWLVHRSHSPRKLTRSGHTAWSISVITYAPSISAPASVTVTPSSAGSLQYTYAVTAVADGTYEESVSTSGTNAACADISTSNITVSWPAVSGAARYNVYRYIADMARYVGTAGGTSFVDTNIEPDMNDTPPVSRTPFAGAGNYPGVVTLYQQRAVYANSDNSPQTMWFSVTGSLDNMSISPLFKDDDAIVATMASRQVNEIRGMVGLNNNLLVLTSGGEWAIGSGEDFVLTPTNITLNPHGYRGAADISPAVIGNNILFVQSGGTVVRDLGYNLEIDGFTGNDLTVMAPHLFEAAVITEWTFAQSPHSIIWCVLSDGTMAAMTYLREHEVWAWHRHDTDGKVESVASVLEGTENAVYLTVKRTIGGVARRFVERFQARFMTDIRDSFFVDCGLSLDVPVTITGATKANPVVITATAHGFADGQLVDIADVEGMSELNNRRFKVASGTANTFALTDEAGNNIDGTGYSAYVEGGVARATALTLTGLDHLEGKEVSILADGSVPNRQTVTNGAVTLASPASRVHVGLPFVTDVETLPIDTVDTVGRRKKISHFVAKVQKSRSLWAGFDADNLREMKFRQAENYGDPTAWRSTNVEMVIPPKWNSDVSLFLRNVDPLPLTVLAVTPLLNLGD